MDRTPEDTATHVVKRYAGDDSWSVLRIVNEGKGAPTSIDVDGSFKCLTCTGFVIDALICEECMNAIRILRSGPHQEALANLLDMIVRNPGFIRALEHMTDEVVATYFIERLRHSGD